MHDDDVVISGDARGDQQRLTDALGVIVERRAIIEQAKGMLMFVYGVDADQAFEVLRKQSQDNNVKLILIAEQVMKDLIKLSLARGPVRQLALGGLIDTANQRIDRSAVRQLDGRSQTVAVLPELGSAAQ